MQEVGFVKKDVGTVRVIGEPDGIFTLAHVDFGEYVDLQGKVWGPLSRQQRLDILTMAQCEADAMQIVSAG